MKSASGATAPTSSPWTATKAGRAPLLWHWPTTSGCPLVDALIAVDNALRREGLRNDVALIASGKIATGGDVATHLALGADLVHIGRGFLFSIGCIQALRCHTNTCPTGVTTQNQWLQSGLDPTDKGVRVRNYALALERDLQMITHACGLTHPSQLHRGHVVMNISPGVRKSLADLFPYPANQYKPARSDTEKRAGDFSLPSTAHYKLKR